MSQDRQSGVENQESAASPGSDDRQRNHYPTLNVPVGDGTHHRMFRFSNKSDAGRILDGRTWDEMPGQTGGAHG